jgi:two-component system sensor histidine kinase DegS
MRSLIFELRPPVLEELGLATAIKTRLQAVEGRSDVAVEFQSSGKEGELPLTVQMELYRITQEALSNVVKHSRAEHVVVHLDYASDHATLEIRDDGDGFDTTKAKEKNTMGVRSMSERTKKINGVLTFEGTPGQGTLVRVEVPYEQLPNPSPSG